MIWQTLDRQTVLKKLFIVLQSVWKLREKKKKLQHDCEFLIKPETPEDILFSNIPIKQIKHPYLNILGYMTS